MYNRNVKSKRILTKLRVHDYEYICDRIAKVHKKILFITWAINIQILTTKYFSFQYSITYCSCQLNVFWEHVRRFPDEWWCQLLWTLWDVQICSSLTQGQKSMASVIKIFCFVNSYCQPYMVCLMTFTFQQDNTPAHRARETVHLLTHETPDFITQADSQQSWP